MDDAPLIARARDRPTKTIVITLVLALAALGALSAAVYGFVALERDNNEEPSNTIDLSEDPNVRLIQVLQKYVQINTAQPSPQYDEAVTFLTAVADWYGYPVETYESPAPGHPFVIMKIEGSNPDLGSVVLLSHMDTVPAVLEYWTHDPFGGEMDENGNIWGRGTQDMKGISAMYMEAIHRLQYNKTEFERTVYLLFTNDEEVTGEYGMPYFVTTDKWNDMNAEVLIDEATANPGEMSVVYYGQRAKVRPWFTFSGPAGHGSQFIDNTAIPKLNEVLTQALAYRAAQEQKMTSNNLTLGMVTTINPTVVVSAVEVDGIYSQNSIPSVATLVFDIRITPADVVEVAGLLYNWSQASNTTISNSTIEVSPVLDLQTNPWWPIIEGSFAKLNLPVSTDIMSANTDGRYALMQNKTVFCYSGMLNTPFLAHAHDEYVNNASLIQGVAIYQQIISDLAGKI